MPDPFDHRLIDLVSAAPGPIVAGMRPRFLHVDRLAHVQAGLAAPVHRHAVSEAVLIIDGRYQVEVDGRTLSGTAGSVFLYPAGVHHRPRSRGAVSLLLLQWQDGDRDLPRMCQDRDGRLLAAGLWMYDLAWSKARAPEAVLDALMLAFLHQARRAEEPVVAEGLVERARAYLSQSLAYDLGLSELAQACHCSPATLSRVCHAAWGVSPMRYRRRLRAERALALLQSGKATLLEVAHAVGYSSGEHLCRVLRTEFGRTSARLRGGLTTLKRGAAKS